MSTTWAAHTAAIRSPANRIFINGKLTPSATALAPISTWLSTTQGGTFPSTAVVPTRTTTGSHPFHEWGDSGAGSLYLGGAEALTSRYSSSNAGGTGTMALLCDRLSHQGGLSGSVTSAQTTNLPTAALTRNTGGVGNIAVIEISNSGIGSTQAVGSISYTNQAGTAGRTGQFSTVGSGVSLCYFCSYNAGDTGVKSVESVTLATSTGSAGNFGVTIIKPIGYIFFPYGPQNNSDPWMSGNMFTNPAVPIDDNACLFLIIMSASSTNLNGSLSFIEY